MGRTDGKISCLILFFCIAALALVGAFAADDTSLIMKKFRSPEYNKETDELLCIVYGERAQLVGVLVNLEELKIDWMGEDGKVVKGTVTTPKGIYDRSTKIIKGEDEVHYRSDAMDVDGVGFDADQKRQTIHIRSKVKVVLRQNLMTDNEKDVLRKRNEKEAVKK